MKRFLRELIHAAIVAALLGGPLFYYLLVEMKP
jgi:ABC-type Fe3+-siderophore transport system permease subunit